ncbi:uncharacterized protein LOC114673166 isoform X2 [Macaca mulatta]
MPCAARCLALSPGCPALGRQARNPRKQGRRGRYLFIPGPGYSPALPWLRTVTIYLCLSGQEHVFTETHKAQSLTLCPDTLCRSVLSKLRRPCHQQEGRDPTTEGSGL